MPRRMREPTIAATHVEISKKPSMESTPKITLPSHPPSSARDAYQYGDDYATWILPGHQHFGDDTREQSYKNPSKYAHDSFLSRRTNWRRTPISAI